MASNESCALAGAPQPGTRPAPRFSAPPREAERMQHPHSPAGRLRATETPWGRAGRSPCTQLRAAGPSAPRAIDSSPQLTQTRSSLICGSSDKSPERRDPRRGRGPRFGGRDVRSSGVVASGHRRPPACRPRVQKGKQEALCPASAHSARPPDARRPGPRDRRPPPQDETSASGTRPRPSGSLPVPTVHPGIGSKPAPGPPAHSPSGCPSPCEHQSLSPESPPPPPHPEEQRSSWQWKVPPRRHAPCSPHASCSRCPRERLAHSRSSTDAHRTTHGSVPEGHGSRNPAVTRPPSEKGCA